VRKGAYLGIDVYGGAKRQHPSICVSGEQSRTSGKGKEFHVYLRELSWPLQKGERTLSIGRGYERQVSFVTLKKKWGGRQPDSCRRNTLSREIPEGGFRSGTLDLGKEGRTGRTILSGVVRLQSTSMGQGEKPLTFEGGGDTGSIVLEEMPIWKKLVALFIHYSERRGKEGSVLPEEKKEAWSRL